MAPYQWGVGNVFRLSRAVFAHRTSPCNRFEGGIIFIYLGASPTGMVGSPENPPRETIHLGKSCLLLDPQYRLIACGGYYRV